MEAAAIPVEDGSWPATVAQGGGADAHERSIELDARGGGAALDFVK